ncbi:LTA synthase family protein [Furfurilactobacillus sp. WILCCON 0119]
MNKGTRNKVDNFAIFIVALWMTIILNQLFFGAAGILNDISNPANNVISKRWLVANLVKYLLNAGQAMLFIWIGYSAGSQKRALKVVVTSWLTTIFVGFLGLLGWMTAGQSMGSGTLWQIFLPIMRNSYPLLTAAGISVLVAPLLTKISGHYVRLLWLIVALAFGLPMILNQDLWGFNNGVNVINSVLLTMIGVLVKVRPIKLAHRKWLWISGCFTILAGGLMLMMIPISDTAHQNISTVNRFVTQNSLLTIGLSVATFLYLIKLNPSVKKNRQSVWQPTGSLLVVITIVLLGNPTFNDLLNKTFGFTVPSLYRKKLLLFLGLCVGILVVTYVVSIMMKLIVKTKWWQQLVNQIVMVINDVWTKPSAVTTGRIKEWILKHRRGLWTTGAFYGLALASITLMNTTGSYVNLFFYTVLFREPVLWFNILFIASFFWLLLALTKRYWVSLLTTITAVVIVIIANVLKIKTREEPILPSDMAEAKALGSLLKMVGLDVVISSVVLIVVLAVVMIWLELRVPQQLNLSLRSRGVLVLVAFVTFGSTFFWNHNHSVFMGVTNVVDDSREFFNQEEGAQKNGPIIQFLNNVDVSVMPEPDGYSKTEIDRIVRRYQHEATTINRTRTGTLKNQTVIMNLSESFSNPNRVPNLTVTPNPIPYITKLKKQTTSGLMLSSGYGGGTANMEYQALTGMAISNFSPTLPTPYTQLVTTLKQAPALTNQFDYSSAIHPYIGVYYNRVAVYKKFNFNKFAYVGSKYPIKNQYKIGTSDYLSDKTAYANTLKQINARKGGQFINLVTMQNHYPFTDKYPDHDYTASGTAFTSDQGQQQIETYAQGLSYTDTAVKAFKQKLDKIKKPIIWVWYGDHLASLYDGDSMTKYGLRLHETDYFIYANKYSRTHGYKQSNDAYVSPNDFSAMTMEQANTKVSPYYALLTRVHQQLPALTVNTSVDNTGSFLNGSAQFVNHRGRIVSEESLTKHQRQLLHDYRLIQYDIVAGKQYALKTHFMK